MGRKLNVWSWGGSSVVELGHNSIYGVTQAAEIVHLDSFRCPLYSRV